MHELKLSLFRENTNLNFFKNDLVEKIENDLDGKEKVGNNHVAKIENDLDRREKIENDLGWGDKC